MIAAALLGGSAISGRPGGISGSGSDPEPERALVVSVTDGDTIRVRFASGHVNRVRYIGIDTPETGRGRPRECFAHEATEANRRLVEGKTVRLEHDVERRDRYGRLLAYVHVGRTHVNAELVRRGFASQLTVPPNVRHAGRFGRLAREAREANRGLWRACSP